MLNNQMLQNMLQADIELGIKCWLTLQTFANNWRENKDGRVH